MKMTFNVHESDVQCNVLTLGSMVNKNLTEAAVQVASVLQKKQSQQASSISHGTKLLVAATAMRAFRN